MSRSVLFIDETAQIGGGEINLLTFARCLPQYGWRPAVLLPSHGPFAAGLQAEGISVHFVPRPPFISTTYQLKSGRKFPNPLALLWSLGAGLIWLFRLYRFLRERRPAVVHTVSIWAHAFGGLAARLAGIPVVWHVQGIVDPEAGWGLYRRLFLLAARFIPQQILYISERVAAPFRTQPHLRERATLLWNTIDTSRFSPAANGRNPTLLRLGTVARLTPWKGQAVALQAAHRLQAMGCPFRWTFAGDEELGHAGYRHYLEQQARELGVAAEVEFVGWVEDMAAFYRQLDVLVHLPTDPEPFGLVLAEALAAGLAVITTDHGGAAPLVLAAGGAVAPPGDSESVAQTLNRWWREPQTLNRLGDEAAAYARRTFSLETYMDQLTAVYHHLADNRHE